MAETLATYIAKVQAECDDTSTSAKTVIEQYVKSTYQDVMLEAKPYLQETVTTDRTAIAGQSNYEADPFEDITLLWAEPNGNFSTLKQISEFEYLDKHINDANGVPRYFYVKSNTYYLVPTPENAGTIKQTIMPETPEITAVSLIPERFTRVIILGATFRFKAYEDNPAANVYRGWFEDAKRRMILDLATRSQTIQPQLYRNRRKNITTRK